MCCVVSMCQVRPPEVGLELWCYTDLGKHCDVLETTQEIHRSQRNHIKAADGLEILVQTLNMHQTVAREHQCTGTHFNRLVPFM